MSIASFDDLMRSAREQEQPQRLLFVFAAAELPTDATPAQRAGFEAGHGGTLTPLMCVDKTPDELSSFTALREESVQLGQAWHIVFVAAMSGSAGIGPTPLDAEVHLQRMVEAIKSGSIDSFIPFDAQGNTVHFT